ncbi:MAG: amidohydrolase family protein, partial [Candidatus Fermentibacteraceae bacterium]|nr:amidohydrolase family protein [Candidatus Fermentibacteraceae bacterium]
MKEENMLTLLRNGRVFDPFDRGRADVLLCGGKVVAVRDSIPVPAGLDVDVVDASDRILTPGFVDLHVHVIGGGGEGGPATRVPEIQLSSITAAGVTTVVGLLGTDDATRHPETLLAKTLGLCAEGISAFMMCGSYQFPPATVTGSVRKDIALIGPVIGVGEVALSDHRSSQPT